MFEEYNSRDIETTQAVLHRQRNPPEPHTCQHMLRVPIKNKLRPLKKKLEP